MFTLLSRHFSFKMSNEVGNQADHTELNTQVSQYFQTIKQYTNDSGFDDGTGVELDLSGLDNANDVEEDTSDYSQLVNVELRPKETIRKRVVKQQQSQQNTPSNLVMKMETRNSSARICPFCSKTFQHSGSLGRHLDHQKGNELHPIEEIEKIRANVARRGNPDEVKARRVMRSREYNRRDYVKEKNRLRRQLQSKFQKAKDNELMRFYRRINVPIVPRVPTFPFLVLMFLPSRMWPHDPPTAETYRMLRSFIQENGDISDKIRFLGGEDNNTQDVDKWLEKIEISFENWQGRTQVSKNEIWQREQRTVFQEVLGGLTYFDYAVRDNYAKHLMNVKKQEMIKMESEKSEYDKLDDEELAAVAAAAAAAVKGYEGGNSSE